MIDGKILSMAPEQQAGNEQVRRLYLEETLNWEKGLFARRRLKKKKIAAYPDTEDTTAGTTADKNYFLLSSLFIVSPLYFASDELLSSIILSRLARTAFGVYKTGRSPCCPTKAGIVGPGNGSNNTPNLAVNTILKIIHQGILGTHSWIWRRKTFTSNGWLGWKYFMEHACKMVYKKQRTTSDKSKFIPVSDESLADNHFKASKDVLTNYYNNFPDGDLLTGKGLVVGGSHQISQ